MDMSFTALLYQIQNILFLSSGLLLIGAVIPLYLETGSLRGMGSSLLSGTGHRWSRMLNVMNEKRRAPRLKSRVRVDIQCGLGRFLPRSAQLQDISAGGACIHSSLALSRGEQISARFTSPRDGLIQISARVVWVKRKTDTILYGLKFQSVATASGHRS